MNEIRVLTAEAECSWAYIDRLRLAFIGAIRERDALRRELEQAKMDLDHARIDLLRRTKA